MKKIYFSEADKKRAEGLRSKPIKPFFQNESNLPDIFEDANKNFDEFREILNDKKEEGAE